MIGPEPACSIPASIAKKAVREWVKILGFLRGSCARRTKKLLELNRNQL
jgi:hypothetical protein